MIERGIFEPGLTGDSRHQPVARQMHLVDDFHADRIERFPRVMPQQSGNYKGDREQGEEARRGRQRKRERGELRKFSFFDRHNHPAILPLAVIEEFASLCFLKEKASAF